MPPQPSVSQKVTEHDPATEKREKLTQAQRRYMLLETLWRNTEHGRVHTSLEELATAVEDLGDANKSSLVSDLTALEKFGVQKKSTGNYSLKKEKDGGELTKWIEPRIDNLKLRIADACGNQMRSDKGGYLLGKRTCFISHGTSTTPLFHFFKRCRPDQRPACVATNSFPGILALFTDPKISLKALGGTPDSRGRFHPETKSLRTWLADVNFQVLVLSCSNFSPDLRISCLDTTVEFRQILLSLAKRQRAHVVVLADSSKLCETLSSVSSVSLDTFKGRLWLFVDRPHDKETVTLLNAFKKKLGARVIDINVRKPGSKKGARIGD